jgi:hypothetical protein
MLGAMTPVSDHAGLTSERLAALSQAVARLATLQEVVRWGFAHEPALEIVEVIVQDEYSHDVIMTGGDGLHLVFDTT